MKIKRGISFILVIAMVMALVSGCGSKNQPGGTEGKTFVIGGLGPLTGAAASYGLSVKQGAEVAIEEINAKGGVKGMKLSMNFQDDEATPDKAVAAYNTLMDSKINVLMGAVTSGSCLAITKLTKEDGILQISPSGSAAKVTEYDNAFRLCFTDPLQGVKMADFAVGTLGKKKIAIIYNNSDEYSTGIMNAFTEEVGKKGGSVVSSQSFKKGDVDFKAQLTAIKATDAEVVFVPSYYEEAALITSQAKEAGLTLPFLGSDGWDGVISKVSDKSVLEGAVFLSPFLASDPAVKDFVDKYKTKYNAEPDQFAADGYDTVYVIKAAIEKAASTDSKDLIAAMTQIEVNGMTGKISFNKDGEPNKDAKFVEIKDGKYEARK